MYLYFPYIRGAKISKFKPFNFPEHPLWKRKTSGCCGESQIKAFGRKYYAFYAYYKIYFIVMVIN